MVKQYLEKIQENLFNKKSEILNDIIDLNNQYKETIEMIKILEETDDPTFEVFTPRKVNTFNRSKVEELKQSQTLLLNQLDVKKQELSQIELDITETNNVIKIENSTIQNIKTLSEKIDKCYELVGLNNYGCKNELTEIKILIYEMKKNR